MGFTLAPLPSLSSSSSKPVALNFANPFAPSGSGWDFSPTGGWGSDGVSSGGGGSLIFGDPFINNGGGGFPPVGAGGGGGGLVISVPPFGSGGGSGGSSGSGGGTATSVSSGSGPFGLFPAINWGRIAAFLLGLILIGAGLMLIKPVNQAVSVVVKNGGRKLAETATA